MNDSELGKLLEPLVRHVFEGFDIDRVGVKSANDHDGDPVIEVEVQLGATSKRYDPEVTFVLARELLGALSQVGDTRFPLIKVQYPSDEPGEDFYPEKRKRRAAT